MNSWHSICGHGLSVNTQKRGEQEAAAAVMCQLCIEVVCNG